MDTKNKNSVLKFSNGSVVRNCEFINSKNLFVIQRNELRCSYFTLHCSFHGGTCLYKNLIILH